MLRASKLQPWNALQLRCWEWMMKTRAGLTGLARAAGVSHYALREWFWHRGSTTSIKVLTGLANVLGIQFEQALLEAGGVTSDQIHRAQAKVLRAEYLPTPGTQAFTDHQRRAARSRRRHFTPASAAASVAARRANGALQRWNDAGIALARTPERRALQILRNFLWWHPSPTADMVKAWVQHAATSLAVEAGVIRSWWRDSLKNAGLHSGAGRPRLEGRCELVRELMAGWGRSASGRLRPGFWAAALERLEAAAEGAPGTEHELLVWWRQHSAICPATLLLPGDGK